MRVLTSGTAIAVCLAIAGIGVALPAAESASPDEQIYRENCASCHGIQLQGSSGPAIGPALKGEAFLAKWGKVPAADFIRYVHATMPLNAPGTLDEQSSGTASRFVLAANGLPVGGGAAPAAPSDAKTGLSSRIAEGIAIPVKPEDQDGPWREAMAARAALIGKVRPVDDAMLASPSPEDWLSWRGNRETQGHSPLKQLDRTNVGRLGLAWSLALPAGTNGIAPLVHDGVMFIHSNGTVEALDATSGESIWRFSRPAKTTRVPSTQPRGIALYGDAVYVPTVDNHVIALDMKTGAKRWDHEIGKPEDMLQLTAAPIVIRGKVIQGVSGCQGSEYGGGCYIVALDAKTGEEVWRFNSIARPGSTGGDSWNGAPVEKRYGGSNWVTGSYDPGLNLFIVGIAQTYTISTLLDPQRVKGRSSDALFTNSTLALDPDTGRLVWYYQHEQGEVWDLDWSFERTLATVDGRRIVVTGGKAAIFDALDAKTGKWLWSRDLGIQNYISAIDPKTGRKTHDPKLIPEIGKPKLVCPSTVGHRNWMSTSYDPATGMLYVPMTPTCNEYSRAAKPNDGAAYGELMILPRRWPDSDGRHGWLAAIDVPHEKVAWIQKRRAPQASAVLTTAGGILFEGGRDRAFRAIDAGSGETLWRTLLPATPNAYPISYMVGGTQYIAIVTGGGTAVDMLHTPMTPEHPPSSGAKTIMVFALPEKGQ